MQYGAVLEFKYMRRLSVSLIVFTVAAGHFSVCKAVVSAPLLDAY